MLRIARNLWPALALLSAPMVSADEIINDDLIVQGSACFGTACEDGEDFQFDTLKLKAPEPRLLIQDTSAGAFPTHDWALGSRGDGSGVNSYFYLEDAVAGVPVLSLYRDGSITLGATAAREAGAISVGSPGNERRIAHVADATVDHDAVNQRQFEAFKTATLATIDDQTAAMTASLTTLSERINALNTRANELAARLQALEESRPAIVYRP
ncbi:hypothetical protein [Alkalilimnicola sp. S0819]|uniref:hypothetical protein n=1 Tax=Alkalilimnicola sp. S0819 TaxID=2613922 RepID=UPI00126206E0|nr:hypothetical protein [Alkalilimnicola sp. S0819]KAB7623991.1 hypothetical protein F3N43_08090 [Alkalilimnicola sp. S0819]MPQ16595.1 hypothetical protein [Alkalilimnicola sp. S0819]